MKKHTIKLSEEVLGMLFEAMEIAQAVAQAKGDIDAVKAFRCPMMIEDITAHVDYSLAGLRIFDYVRELKK